jgi:hypothetical protein
MPVDLDAPNRAGMRLFGAAAQTGSKWTYTPQGGDPFDIDVIYDEAWSTLGVQGIGRGGFAPVSTTKPAILMRLKDVPQGIFLKQDDTMRDNASARSFSVADAQPDGMGCMRLMLNEIT